MPGVNLAHWLDERVACVDVDGMDRERHGRKSIQAAELSRNAFILDKGRCQSSNRLPSQCMTAYDPAEGAPVPE